jgi:heme-degrading monooxygenase HmoA
MPVLMTAENPGQTREGYDGMVKALGPVLKNAKGFIAHFTTPTPDGWRVMEVWETADDATQFFAKYVHPNLPPGVKPQRSFTTLHNIIRS